MVKGCDNSVIDEVERARWRTDPVGFVRERLGATPWGKQREILEALRDHSYVARSVRATGRERPTSRHMR